MVEFPDKVRNFFSSRSPNSLRDPRSFLFNECRMGEWVLWSKYKVDYCHLVPSPTKKAATLPLANMHLWHIKRKFLPIYKQTNKMLFLHVFIPQFLYKSTCFEGPFLSSSGVLDLLYLQLCTNRANVSNCSDRAGSKEPLEPDAAQTKCSSSGWVSLTKTFVYMICRSGVEETHKNVYTTRKVLCGKQSYHESAAHCFHQSELPD